MGSCFKKKTGTSTKYKGSKIRVDRPKGGRGSYETMRIKANSDLDNLKMDLGIKKKNTAYYRDLAERSEKSKKALKEHQERRRRDRRRGRKDDDDDIITNNTDTDTDTNTNTTTTTTTIIGEGVGDTSATPSSIYTQDPNKAMEAQELLAQDELRRQRIKRARAKQSLLRKRIERDREVGSGRRVLSGTERELNVQTRQAGTGRRGGTGRRSLITGSTGGIGYYSRFL
tara:strand:+ start:467 stop:1150 length:684 start_codon:yes stop_codon:yes gene_type:complete